MALTQITTSGLANGAVTSDKISNTVQLGGPTITQIQITDSSYDVLDDTAVSTSGGYIKITGTGFAAGAIVVIGSVNATSTGFVSSTVLNVQVPALSAGTYTVYVVNSNGGTAIGVNGLTYSAEPNWVTDSTLPSGSSGSAISIQLDATEATTYTLQAGSSLPDGLTLTSGGLLSGTVTVGIETIYSFTVVATDAQSQDSPRAFTITITAGDPYFYLTTLLLPGNGTNNGTNNTFLDSSTNSLSITRTGTTTQGTASPFSQTGWSNYFDGSGDFLSWSGSTIGTQPFTAEMWVYPNSVSGTIALFGTTVSGGFNLRIKGSTSQVSVDAYNTAANDFTVPAWTANQWYHIVAVRNASNQLTVFVNGVRSSTGIATMSTNFGATTKIGQSAELSDFNGYISNARLVIGSAVYDPTQSTITVPTAPLTAVANTSILTCQSNRFIDNSTNNFSITVSGDTVIQSFSPFNPTASYTTASVGGAMYIPNGVNALTVASVPAIGTGSFTIEGWFWPIASDREEFASAWTLYAEGFNGSNSAQGGVSRSVINFRYNGTSGFDVTGLSLTNKWNHIAWVRNGTTATIYLNGVSVGTGSFSNSISAGALWISRPDSGSFRFNGWMSGFRVVSSAVYTSNFTPPTSPPTAISNTQVLLNFTNGQITDATSKNILETVGDAKISTAQSKFGGSSMYFDGSGDSLLIPASKNFAFGTGDFTVEFWMRSTDTDFNLIGLTTAAAGNWNLVMAGSSLYWQSQYATTNLYNRSGTSILDGNWHHIAITRASGTNRMFFDGVLQGSSTADSTNYTAPNNMQIGTSSSYGDFSGYIDDLRITKGYARYTSNFTPPTSAFQTQ